MTLGDNIYKKHKGGFNMNKELNNNNDITTNDTKIPISPVIFGFINEPADPVNSIIPNRYMNYSFNSYIYSKNRNRFV